MTHKHRVVITGVGLVSSLGNSTEQTWSAALSGRSGICDHISLAGSSPEGSSHASYVAGVVHGEQSLIDAVLSAKEQRKTARFTQLGLIATGQAIAHAGLSSDLPKNRERIGV